MSAHIFLSFAAHLFPAFAFSGLHGTKTVHVVVNDHRRGFQFFRPSCRFWFGRGLGGLVGGLMRNGEGRARTDAEARYHSSGGQTSGSRFRFIASSDGRKRQRSGPA